jgi:ubiquinone/menaquinone biosynthesis C-methylase UbiE
MDAEEQDDSTQTWQASAKYWDKYRPLITQMFGPVTSALIEEAQIGVDHNVLDIGGGGGEPSLTISGVVGPSGCVVFTDPAPGMLEAARAEANRRGLTNIQFKQCAADNLPMADNTVDIAVGRFSVMFFPDPVGGIREVLRVVRSNGHVSFAVWGSKDANPFFSTMNDVFDRLVESTNEDPEAPDPFRFAVSGALAEIMKEAGAGNVTERQLDFEIEAPISFEQFWQLRSEMSASLREKLAGLTPEKIKVIKHTVRDVARKYFASGTMNFPARALILTGRRR